uniref:G-protein coupled receptors family 1 profile domain-containing protein n=1 Tax=Lepisosteus oculatus TaxID=7918 RepID=W5NM96_LEPOC
YSAFQIMPFRNVTTEVITEFVITGFNGTQHPRTVGFCILTIYFLILLGNTTNICIIARDRHLHTPMYFFVSNLAVVDILRSTSTSPTMIIILLADMTTISYKQCLSQLFISGWGDTMEVLTITLMAYDRLVAISNPLRYHSFLTKSRVVVLTVLSWVLACAVVAIVTGIADRLPYCRQFLQYAFCDYGALVRAACVNTNDQLLLPSAIFSTITFGSLTFILMSYLKIIFAVIKISSPADRKKMYNTCLSHLIVVACIFVPPLIGVILTRIGLVLSLVERHVVITLCTLGPSLLNPFVYCFRTKEIRNQV